MCAFCNIVFIVTICKDSTCIRYSKIYEILKVIFPKIGKKIKTMIITFFQETTICVTDLYAHKLHMFVDNIRYRKKYVKR